LTRQARFATPRINFSKYELIQILGWRQEGKSYQRIDESLKRWLGVTLYYEKAWWNKQAACWIDAGFHLIEQISLARKRTAHVAQGASAEPAISSFTWNAVVFQSFQAGYIKQLDMDLYRQLNGSIAKRMFRFLDKRFYHRATWDFPLVEFACEHIGVSRSYDAAQLKRRLLPAIKELERVGFLKPMPAELRFVRIGRGNWRAFFAKLPKRAKPSEPAQEQVSLQPQLISRGVTSRVAAQIVSEHRPESIEDKLAAFDALLAAKDSRVSRNPAGYLVSSIRKNYATPRGLTKPVPQTSGPGCGASQRRHSRVVTPPNTVDTERVEAYLKTLSKEELARISQQAEQHAPAFLKECRERGIASGNSTLQKTFQASTLRFYVLRILEQQTHPQKTPPS